MPSYEIISNMDYLDMFIREVLRMFPIAPGVVTRTSAEDFEVKGYGSDSGWYTRHCRHVQSSLQC